MIHIIPIQDLPIIKEGDDLKSIIWEKLQNLPLKSKDVIVIAHTIVSKAEGRIWNIDQIIPSQFAINWCQQNGKDPRIVELVLREAKSIVRMNQNVIITETHSGWICANSGIDQSNVPLNHAIAHPKNPDETARKLRIFFEEKSGKTPLAVIISDSFGRALRRGIINVAIGCSGLDPLLDLRGKARDLHGRTLKSTIIAVADELAAAAGLVMGQANEKIPVVVIRGYDFVPNERDAKVLIRSREEALFW